MTSATAIDAVTGRGTPIKLVSEPRRIFDDLAGMGPNMVASSTIFTVLDTDLILPHINPLFGPISTYVPQGALVNLSHAFERLHNPLPPTPVPTPINLEAGTVRTVDHFFPPGIARPVELEKFSFDRLLRRLAKRYAASDSPDFNKFVSLAQWLDLDQQELATALGIERTTPYAWRDGSVPRRKTVRKLQQFYAFCSALVQRIGESATREFLGSGEPTARQLLIDGNLAEAQRRARPLLFEHVGGPRSGAWLPDVDGDDAPQNTVGAANTAVDA